jgi:AcrR family transcriptional regulator
MSLREQKRAVVRLALSDAALRLALERGLANVLVKDIASAVGVSPRTFNNYFSCKEEALVAPAFDRIAQVLETLAHRPAAEPLWEAVTQSILVQFAEDGDADPEMAAQVRLVRDSPGLWGEQLKMYARIERLLADAVAERLAVTLEQDLVPRLVAAAAIGASRVAFEHWLDRPTDAPFGVVLVRALQQAGQGFAPKDGKGSRW